MSLKTKFLCGTILGLSWFSAQKAHASAGTDIKKDTLEISTDTLKHNQSQQKNNTISLADTISSDSLIMAKKEANFAKAEKLMFYLIAHFEGFRSHPYRLKGEKFRTYNIGNTTTAEGRPVRATDRIDSPEEAFEVYNNFIHTQQPLPLKDAMIQALPIDKMEDFEIAVMGEIGYNYGPGLFLKKEQPTEFAQLAAAYFNNRTPETLDAFSKSFLAHNTARGRVHPTLGERRKVGDAILREEIIITVDDDSIAKLPLEKQKKAINLKTCILGTLVALRASAKDIPDKIIERTSMDKFTCESGDSIQHAIEIDSNRFNRKSKKLTLAQLNAAKKRRMAQR